MPPERKRHQDDYNNDERNKVILFKKRDVEVAATVASSSPGMVTQWV